MIGGDRIAADPNAALDATLEWIEQHIDLEHLGAVDQRHRDALHYRTVDRPPFNIKGVCVDGLVRYPSSEELGDPVKTMVNQLSNPIDDLRPGIVSSVLLKDDFPLQILAERGVGIIASLFGCKSRILDDGMPWVDPIGDIYAVAAVVERGVPDLNQGLLPEVLELMAFFKQKLAQYDKCSRGIHIQQPDLQGMLDILHLMCGSEIFLHMAAEPELIHRLLDVIADTYIAVLNKIRPYTTEEAGDGCIYLHWAMCRGNLLLKNDSSIMISPRMYEDIIRPHDEKVLRIAGEGGIHFCGCADHWMDQLAATDGLTCVDFGQPHLNDIHAWYNTLADRKVAIMRLPHPTEEIVSGQYKHDFPTGATLSVKADDLDHGKRIMATVNEG